MRKIMIGLSGVLLVASVAAPAAASKPRQPTEGLEAGHKVTICHRTSSTKTAKAYRVITVDIASSGGRRKLMGHLRHTLELNNRGRADFIPGFTYPGYPPFAGASHEGADTTGLSDKCVVEPPEPPEPPQQPV